MITSKSIAALKCWISININNKPNQAMKDPPSPRKRYVNRVTRKNQVVFGITLIFLQIGISVAYAVVGKVGAQTINMGSVFTAIFLAMLVVVGFGMHYGYLKHLIWSSIGFCLMITCLSIQVYPLANALWGKLQLHQSTDTFSNRNFTLALANMDATTYQNNTITGAIKCALSIIVAFGSLIGRIGPLQCLFLSLLGVLGYDFNRSVVSGIGQDLFGTFSIFAFGGFMGLVAGIIMRMRERKKFIDTYRNERLEGNTHTVVHSIFGNIAIFILFPFLAFEGDQSLQGTTFQKYTGPLSIVLSMGSAVVTSIFLSLLIYGDRSSKIRLKDVLNAQIAGGIICGAASFYITTPYLGVIAGVAAGFTQYFFDNVLERKIYKKWGVVSTYSFTIYCLQSLLGAIFALAYDWRVSNNATNDFVFPTNIKSQVQEIIIYFISSGIGIGCGILIGVICYLLNTYKMDELFHDQTVFQPSDGIAYSIEKDTDKDAKSAKFGKQSDLQSQQSNRQQQIAPQRSADSDAASDSALQSYEQPSESSDNSFDFVDMNSVIVL